MQTDDALRVCRYRGDILHQKRGSVCPENCVGFANLAQALKYITLNFKIFKYRLNHDVGIGELAPIRSRGDISKDAFDLFRLENAALNSLLEKGADSFQACLGRVFV
ncbi:MAG: hypothetical protein QF524_03830 [Planctomycetota bacterium]|jgi:hypothetical protein|nr:hypothetical protein [Planctomycetota bacterium]